MLWQTMAQQTTLLYSLTDSLTLCVVPLLTMLRQRFDQLGA